MKMVFIEEKDGSERLIRRTGASQADFDDLTAWFGARPGQTVEVAEGRQSARFEGFLQGTLRLVAEE